MSFNNSSFTCDGSNCTLPEAVVMIVYSSNTERILSLTLIISILVVSLIGQFSVIITICRTQSLHMPHFIIIVCYCAFDLVVIVSQSVMYVWCLVAGSIPLWLCRALSLTSCTIFGMVIHIGYMAFERYMYFCRPMKYERLFTTSALVTTMLVIYGGSCGYCIITEVEPGRDYHSSVMACNLSSRLHTWLQLFMFILPTLSITIFCTTKIWRLSTQMQSTVNPVGPNGQQLVTPKVQAGRALRVILLVSGVFWTTTFPVSITRSIYFNSGITWQDLDSRRSYTQAITLRSIYFLYTLISPLLNPLIYFYSRKDLRMALRRVVGIDSNTIGPQNQD